MVDIKKTVNLKELTVEELNTLSEMVEEELKSKKALELKKLDGLVSEYLELTKIITIETDIQLKIDVKCHIDAPSKEDVFFHAREKISHGTADKIAKSSLEVTKRLQELKEFNKKFCDFCKAEGLSINQAYFYLCDKYWEREKEEEEREQEEIKQEKVGI